MTPSIWWRLRFTAALVWTFLDLGCVIRYVKMGWDFSATTKYTDLPPHEAALEEIADWYR